MANPYRGGTPDMWYSGPAGDLWVEYKYLSQVPRRGMVVPSLTELQKRWLKDRYTEGRSVAVIVGCSAGGVLYLDLAWIVAVPVVQFMDHIEPRERLAAWLDYKTRGTPCPSLRALSSLNGRSVQSTAL